jgi:DNA-directed RNA polymerase subunit RPC12/RpoP
MAGSRIDCPKCHAKVLVPGISPKATSGSEDDQWFSLEPPDLADPGKSATEKSSTHQTPSSDSGEPPRSLFDEDLPDLIPLQEPPPAPNIPTTDPRSSNRLPQSSSRGEQALREALSGSEDLFEDPADSQKPSAAKATLTGSSTNKPAAGKPKNAEYSVKCKVCNTLLTVRESNAGTQVKCPDCYSMILIPPPPAKKAPADMKIDQLEATVQLAPIEGNNPRIVSGASVNTKEMLSKASKELERERKEIEDVKGAFDSKEWLSRNFGFLSDKRLILALVALGIATSVVYYLQGLLPHSTETDLQKVLQTLRPHLLLATTFPIQIAIFICAVAVIPKSANRVNLIEPWPFFQNVKDYLGPACIGLIVFLLVGVLASLLGASLSVIKIPTLLQDAFAQVILWGSLPIIFLSMLELRSFKQPVSGSILKSISAKPDAWGAMYMQSAIAWLMYFVLWQIAILKGPAIGMLAGFVFPWYICFVANQYGVLAGRISDVTDLGYEGVFAESE